MAKQGSIEISDGIVCPSAHVRLTRWLAVKDGNLQAVFSIVRANKRAEFLAAEATAKDVAAGKYDEGAEVAAAKAYLQKVTENLALAARLTAEIGTKLLAVGIELQAARNKGAETEADALKALEEAHANLVKEEAPLERDHSVMRLLLPQAEAQARQAVESRKQQAEQDAEAALEAAQQAAQPIAEVSVTIPEVRGQDVRADAWAELLKQRPDIAAMDDTK